MRDSPIQRRNKETQRNKKDTCERHQVGKQPRVTVTTLHVRDYQVIYAKRSATYLEGGLDISGSVGPSFVPALPDKQKFDLVACRAKVF